MDNKKLPNADELQKLWEDPANWRAFSYYCAKDPRVIVPKRNQALGWTVNTAHGKEAAIMMFLGALIALVGPVSVIAAEGAHLRQLHLLFGIVISGGLLTLFCWYFSKRSL